MAGAVRGFPLAVVVAAVVFSGTLIPGPAFAQNRESTERAAARAIGYAGVDAFQAGHFQLASEKLEKAYAVLRVPSLGLWSARALVKLGKPVEAADRYLEVTRLPIGGGDDDVQRRAKSDAETELASTQASIPSVIIHLDGAAPSSIELTIDGAKVSSQLAGEATPLNPGPHKIEASSGSAHAVSDVTLAPQQQQEVTLHFEGQAATPSGMASAQPAASTPAGAPPSPSSDRAVSGRATRRTLGWVVLGGGAAGLVVGGVAGGLALSKRSQLDENPGCKDDHSCPSAVSGDVHSLNTLRTLSSVGFIAGGVLAATGVVLLVTSPASAPKTSLAVWLAPSSAGVSGKF
jgi:hypothetical protein